jgi:MFS family permease
MPAPRLPRFALPTLFAVVFIDLVGFGIVVPLVPFYAERLGARPELITLIIALHALFQALAMPLWGRLSDRSGRRPVLLLSMLGHAASYVLMAYADTLWLLALARALSGITSANLSTAYAYITDVTSPAARATAMGRISAAFGLGFAVGPAIGGALAGGATMAEANLMRPAFAAALFSLAAAAAIAAFLPETRDRAARHAARNGTQKLAGDFARVSRRPVITQMIALALLVVSFMAARESIYPLWAHYQLGFNAHDIGLTLAYGGLLITAIQLLGIGRLSGRFGEIGLVKAAIVLFALAWIGLAAADDMRSCLVALTLQAIGIAFFQTCMQTLISRRAGAHERGLVLGVYQSSSAFARFVGQASAGTLYAQIGVNAPFLLGAACMLPALWLAWRIGAASGSTIADGAQ